MVKRIYWTYLGISLLTAFPSGLVMACYVPYLLESGLDLEWASYLNMCFMLVAAFLQVPTGMFADRYGRKLAFVLGEIFWALGKIVYGTSHGIAGFFLAEMTAALGLSLQAGAFESWMVDSIIENSDNEENGHKEVTRLNIYARAECVSLGAYMAGSIAGGYISYIGYSQVWLLAGILLLGSAVVAAFIMPDQKPNKAREAGIKLGEALQIAWANKPLRFVAAITFAQYLALQALNMQWAVHFGKTYSKGTMGIIGALIFFGLFVGAKSAGSISGKLNGSKPFAMVFTQLFIGLSVLGMVIFPNVAICLLFFISHEMGRGAYKPLRSAYLNPMLTPELRTTMQSAEQLAAGMGAAIGLIVSGITATNLGISYAWFASGLILVLSASVTFRTATRLQAEAHVAP